MTAKKKEVDDTVPVHAVEKISGDVAPKKVVVDITTDWGKVMKDPDKLFPAIMEAFVPSLLASPKDMPAYHVEYRRQFGRDSVQVNFSSPIRSMSTDGRI